MAALGAVIGPIGCAGKQAAGDPAAVAAQAQLREVYELLLMHQDLKKRPAASVQDLKPYDNAYPTGLASIRSGEVVVNWGAPPTGSDAVLAHGKQAATQGGWVLLQGGTVRELTADEFKSAPKAKK